MTAPLPNPITLNTDSPQYANLVAAYPTSTFADNKIVNLQGNTALDIEVSSGSPTITTSDIGDVLSFDGDDVIQKLGVSVSTTNFSFSVWYRQSEYGGGNEYGPCRFTGPGSANELRTEQEYPFTWNCSGGCVAMGTANTSPLNQWNHIVCTYADNLWKMYLNGNQDGTVTDVSNFIWTLTGIQMGRAANSYVGLIADLRVYNSILTPEEVTDLYNNPWDLYNGGGGGQGIKFNGQIKATSIEEVEADIAANGPYSYGDYNLTFTKLSYDKANSIVYFYTSTTEVDEEDLEAPLPSQYEVTETKWK